MNDNNQPSHYEKVNDAVEMLGAACTAAKVAIAELFIADWSNDEEVERCYNSLERTIAALKKNSSFLSPVILLYVEPVVSALVYCKNRCYSCLQEEQETRKREIRDFLKEQDSEKKLTECYELARNCYALIDKRYYPD